MDPYDANILFDCLFIAALKWLDLKPIARLLRTEVMIPLIIEHCKRANRGLARRIAGVGHTQVVSSQTSYRFFVELRRRTGTALQELAK